MIIVILSCCLLTTNCSGFSTWEELSRRGMEIDFNLTRLKDIDTWFDKKPEPDYKYEYECGHPVKKDKNGKWLPEPYCPICGMKLIRKNINNKGEKDK